MTTKLPPQALQLIAELMIDTMLDDTVRKGLRAAAEINRLFDQRRNPQARTIQSDHDRAVVYYRSHPITDVKE